MASHQSESRRKAALAFGLGLVLGPAGVGTAAGQSWTAAGEPPAPRSVIALAPQNPDPLQEEAVGEIPGLGIPGRGLGSRRSIDRMLGGELTAEQIREIDAKLLENILLVEDPTERSLVLIRAAVYKLLARDYETARRALDLAAEAAVQMPEPLRRDLRLIALHETFIDLAQEDINESVAGAPFVFSLDAEPAAVDPAKRAEALERAYAAFERSFELAGRVVRDQYRVEALYFAAEQMAAGGRAIGNLALREADREAEADVVVDLKALADRFLVRAAEHAAAIGYPVWRDVALDSVAAGAAASDQFDRAIAVARSIEGIELRIEALITVAEAEVRSRNGSPERATAVYHEAAKTVASVPIADLRSTLNDVLIESLIAAGRFPDARRCIAFYPDDLDRMEALGAVAEQMGMRGLSAEAREWIAAEVLPAYRGELYRRVNDGILGTLERYGSEAMPAGDAF